MSQTESPNIAEERMKILLRLINDKKISEEKRVELEVEYCFLVREAEENTKK